jgi:hypothetical protein
MAGRIVYEVASLISATAADKLAECMEEGDSEQINYRSSLLLALVASETEKDTSKEELIAYLGRFYDLIHNPSTPPPPKRTESGEIRIEIRLPPN